MPVFISNNLYLAGDGSAVRNRPIILWESLLYPAGYVVSTFEAGYPGAALWSGDTYTRWKSEPAVGAETETLRLVKSGSNPVDCIGISGHNLFKAGINYRIFTSADNVTFTPLTPVRVPVNNRAILEYFDATTNFIFKIEFYVPTLMQVSIAHVKLGEALVLQRPRYVGETPSIIQKTVEKISSKSFSGQHLGSILISQGDKFSISQDNNTALFVRSQKVQDFFAHAHLLQKKSIGCVETFFYAWRPADYPLEVQYCGETKEFTAPSNTRNNGMVQWSMSGDAFE